MNSPRNARRKQQHHQQQTPGSSGSGGKGSQSSSTRKSSSPKTVVEGGAVGGTQDAAAQSRQKGSRPLKSGDKVERAQSVGGVASPSKDKKPTISASSSDPASNRAVSSQDGRKASHDKTAPIRKRTSLSGSKDDGEGRGKGTGGAGEDNQKKSSSKKEQVVGESAPMKKPSTKAERRALQEAQRKAKAERQVLASKAGQVAREERVSKETKSGGHKGTGGGGGGGGGGGEMSSHLSKLVVSKSHSDVAGLKQVQHFSHLPQYERKARITSLLKEHQPPPCILKLGLEYSEEHICGSNARCVAMLAAFKKVIQEYTIPPQKELRRDLDSVIKPYINFLAHCRPLSVSMGNAIKYLKLKISQISPEIPLNEAKKSLCGTIDDYIQEKIELADKAISEFCGKVIDNGDVILVHSYSSIVQCCLIDAHKTGKKFRVIVVDSRPKMEGRECLRQLVTEGIKCSYVFINAVSYIMKEVSKVIVGAHGLLANGYVMSRVGTSLIALVAKSYNVPVLVCCETYKFCDKVQTDAFVINELGDPNDLVPINRRQGNFLHNWKSIENLQLLNLVYDVTSPDLISMVITQLGNIPCTSVPVVLRISRTFEQM